jgi:hypothetical protein
MFELLRMVTLVGFNPSGPESADRYVTDACDPVYQRAVARRSSHLSDFQHVGGMAVHCADGNMPGRWDRPVFSVETTIEEMSGERVIYFCRSFNLPILRDKNCMIIFLCFLRFL